MSDTTTSGFFTKPRILALGGAAGLALVAVLVWYFVFRDDAPASVTSVEAEDARDEALAEAGGDSVESIDGTWSIDTSVGTFDQTCLTEVCDSTFVGFRIDEELARIGAKTVVGRTPGVTGTLTFDGSSISAVEVAVDMTGLITDDNNRNNQIRRQAIETDAFPEASFSLTEPIELGTIPGVGERISVAATGDLTIHGVTRSETIPLMAEFDGTRLLVFGEVSPILLSDYDISKPTAVAVLSVEDNAIMELQLFFAQS